MAKNQKVMGTVMEKILGIEEVTGCEAVVMRGAEEVRMLAEWYGFWGGGGKKGREPRIPLPTHIVQWRKLICHLPLMTIERTTTYRCNVRRRHRRV